MGFQLDIKGAGLGFHFERLSAKTLDRIAKVSANTQSERTIGLLQTYDRIDSLSAALTEVQDVFADALGKGDAFSRVEVSAETALAMTEVVSGSATTLTS